MARWNGSPRVSTCAKLIGKIWTKWVTGFRCLLLKSERSELFFNRRIPSFMRESYYYDSLQEELVVNPTPEILRIMNDLKRNLIMLRKSIWPLREVISGLQRVESPLIQESTGIYGMNFKYFPELGWKWSYPLVLLGMVFIGVSMLVYFRRKKWF